MALLTRISVGGVGQTYGTITAKAESGAGRPGDILTRIAVGGVGQEYTVTDKAESGAGARPGTLFTRIGVGGVGITYTVTDKGETVITTETPGYYGTGYPQKRIKDDEEIIALIMAMYESNIFH